MRIADAPPAFQEPSQWRLFPGDPNFYWNGCQPGKLHELGELDVLLSIHRALKLNRLMRLPIHHRGKRSIWVNSGKREKINDDRVEEVTPLLTCRWRQAPVGADIPANGVVIIVDW